jgi:hypothetical protein
MDYIVALNTIVVAVVGVIQFVLVLDEKRQSGGNRAKEPSNLA